MTADRRHMDPSTLEMLLILKYNKDLWSAQTIDNIMNSDTSQLTGQKRTLPDSIASVDRVSDCASVSDLDCRFYALFFAYLLRFPSKLKTVGNNWNTIGSIAILLLGAILLLLQYYSFGHLGNTFVVQNRGNTTT